MARRRAAARAQVSALLAANGRFPELLQAAIRASGLTLTRISDRLVERGQRASTTTLSNWQRGTTLPHRASSLAALTVLEEVLGLPDGALAAAAERSTAPAGERDTSTLVPAAGALQRLKERVGLDRLGGYDTLSLHESHVVGPQGVPVRHETVQVIRPVRADFDAYHYFFLTRDGLAPDDIRATVTALTGCTVGEALFEPPDIACVPLLFPEPLPVGETHLFEYATHLQYDGPPPEPEFRRALSRPLEQMLLRVTFFRKLPTQVFACEWHDPAGPPAVEVPLRLDADGSTHHLLMAPQAGIYGIRWVF